MNEDEIPDDAFDEDDDILMCWGGSCCGNVESKRPAWGGECPKCGAIMEEEIL